MWILELTLSTLWMVGVVLGWTLGGGLHVLALLAVALVLIEGTPLERRIRSFRFSLPRTHRAAAGSDGCAGS